MAIGYLITYEYRGKKGNDFSKVEPFQWLLDYREKFPGIVLTAWKQTDVSLGLIDHVNDMIDINKDLPLVNSDVPIVEEPIDSAKQKRIENLAKAREAKQKKAENGNSSK